MREFKEEWMLSAHMKTHEQYRCEQCDKTFKHLDIKKKHVLIQHENAKLYCHFYNNQKTCPYEDECIFLHEDAKFCKYDQMCERNFCMFKHKSNDESKNDEDNDEFENKNDDDTVHGDEVDQEGDNDKLEEFGNDKDDETMNRTFSNPSQDTSLKKFECENCDFRAESKSDLNNHKTAIHNWCPTCFSSFITQERLILHKSKKHSIL